MSEYNCDFSKCKNKATYIFYSYEESVVYLCDRHTVRNILKKTGYVDRRLS